MSTFELAIPTVLRHEGGYINNPNDPGGATKYGISLRWLKAQGLYGDVNGDLVVDIRDIQALTVDQAEGFYRVKWWDKYGFGRILDQTIGTKLFDTAVNLGTPRAVRILQQAINSLGAPLVGVDGCLGAQSVQAVNSLPTGLQLLYNMRSLQAGYYESLVAANANFQKFMAGWRARAYDRV